MAIARSELIDLNETSYYHCITRCVRRAYLCGDDPEKGRDFSHRKLWLINRMKSLAECFAIRICAYAVMSNHYHLVLFVDSKMAQIWPDEEVQLRWSMLFPRDGARLNKMHPQRIAEKLIIWRERLTSISWFMRCLNENIALLANEEDECKGRFWEGRFKSQALLDEGAILTAMAYVDLNPIRAKMADTPENSEFTSIYERIQYVTNPVCSQYSHKQQSSSKIPDCNIVSQPPGLMPFSRNNFSNMNQEEIDFNLEDYLELVDLTGRIIRDDKPGAIPESMRPILERLRLTPTGWLTMVQEIEDKFFYAVGDPENLNNFGQTYECKKNPKGGTAAKQYYL